MKPRPLNLLKSLLVLSLLSVYCDAAIAAPPPPAGKELDWIGPLDERMMDGLHKFIERKLDDAAKNRERFWKRDFSSKEAYEKSVEPNRQHLRSILGIKAERLPTRVEYVGTDEEPAVAKEAEQFRVRGARWLNSERFLGEGLILEPKGAPTACVIVLPSANGTPEAESSVNAPPLALVLANHGCQVIVPALINLDHTYSGREPVSFTNQTHREWIWRQSFHIGLHPLGLEVDQVQSLVDWLEKRFIGRQKIAVAGSGEGGVIALLAAATDTRIAACYTRGAFTSHGSKTGDIYPIWDEPLYRHIWKFHQEFGHAELASLIAPRPLLIETSDPVRLATPAEPQPGRINSGAFSQLDSPSQRQTQTEINRLHSLLPKQWQNQEVVDLKDDRHLPDGIERFARQIAVTEKKGQDSVLVEYDGNSRQARLVRAMEDYVQEKVRAAERKRETEILAPLPKRLGAESWTELAKTHRDRFWRDHLGKFDDPYLPLNPRVRQVYDREKWTGYDVVLDVFPDVFAWGVLLVPKDIKDGERRPVVVCQHGRNGLPKDVIEGDVKAYHDFAARLCDRGFIVFAPHNPYRGEDKYRYLSRKANGIGCTLFSFILAQHEQILSWLGTLPYVDDERIAFYGLSYGGETAVRVPPILTKYCLSICSADFNMWTRKVASTEERFCFPYTIEWEMPYWDMGNHFDYAEMAYLMAPRPFMVERGHRDGVSKDEWVAYEYAKVRRFYDELGIGDRTEIEFFNGVHEINGQGTFEFLHKHLKWPKR